MRCSKPPSGAAACCASTASRTCSTWRKCSPNSRARGTAADHRDQRRRSRRAGHGCADHGRRRTGRTLAGNDGGARRCCCLATGATAIPSTSSATPIAGALRQGARDRGQRSEHDGLLVDSDAAGHDRSHPHRRTVEAATPKQRRQAAAGQLDGRRDVAAGEETAQPRQHSHLPLPGYRGARLHCMWQYADNLQGAVPDSGTAPGSRHPDAGPRSGEAVLSRGRGPRGAPSSPSWESKQVLAAYGIPRRQDHIAASSADAVKAADAIGYPVVVKLYSETITHKTDVGGVQLESGQPPTRWPRRSTQFRHSVTAAGRHAFWE